MRLIVLCSIAETWQKTEAFLEKLDRLFSRMPEQDCSIWLVQDGALPPPPDWSSFAPSSALGTHIVELLGFHGSTKAVAAALAYVSLDLELDYEAILLIERQEDVCAEDIATVLETAQRQPEIVIAGDSSKRSQPIFHYFFSALTRTLIGQRLRRSPIIFLPRSAAEALCQSSHTSCHLSATISKLRLPHSSVRLPKAKFFVMNRGALAGWTENLLKAVTVFRETFAMRGAGLSAIGFLLSLTAVLAGGISATTHSAAPIFWLAMLPLIALMIFGGLFVLFVCLAIGWFANSTMRPWTPALDSATIIRSVHQVKRIPYALPERSAF